jgi:hypothetical protein
MTTRIQSTSVFVMEDGNNTVSARACVSQYESVTYQLSAGLLVARDGPPMNSRASVSILDKSGLPEVPRASNDLGSR